ncbi:MAG: hypothetical protein KDD35_12610, partial [Bdellovibrionales bacterium]|nr:hypothetical protein [Bdellovibrionales bacterium]
MKVTRPLIYLSSLSIILFFWVGFHFVQVGRHCLSSPLVNSVIFLGPKDEIASQLPSCDLAEYLRFWRPLAVGPEQKKILSRVLFLSRAQQLNLKSISPKIEVRISTIDPQIFMRGPGRILIGSEIINSAGFLERALLQEWLRSQSPLIGSDVFQLEVMSLLLWGYLTDSLVTTDPHTQAYVDLSQNKNWSRWIVSQSDYCYSPWVAFVHWENCQVKLSKLLASQGVSGSRKTIEKTALAPYVASIIWNLYESGGLKTKINFWRSWKLSWSAQAVFSRSSLPELVEPKSIGDVLNWTSKVVKIYWTSLGHSSPVDPLIESLVDIMVEGKSIPHRTLDDLTKFSKLNLDKIILIKLGENLLFEGLREVPL